jgi:hypothetical protein
MRGGSFLQIRSAEKSIERAFCTSGLSRVFKKIDEINYRINLVESQFAVSFGQVSYSSSAISILYSIIN